MTSIKNTVTSHETRVPVKKKRTRFVGAPRFPLVILKDIEPMDSTKTHNVKKSTQNIYVEDKTNRIVYIIAGLFLWFLCAIILGFDDLEALDVFEKVIFYMMYISPLALILYGLLIPKKKMVLDRVNGLITIPRMFWRKSLTFPFSEGEAVITSVKTGGISHRIEIWQNGVRSRGGVLFTSPINDTLKYVEEYWSFVVWYMDKNRPLPPGKIFDPYRQADFERRRNEDFQAPLYQSNIVTPETTPEQQKERDAVWSKGLK